MTEPHTKPPLFSSGAIVLNCEFDLIAGAEQHARGGRKRRLFALEHSTDCISIQPHEVVFTTPMTRRNTLSPPVLSSLNGFGFEPNGSIHQAIQVAHHASAARGAGAASIARCYDAYRRLRDELFEHVQLVGVSTAAWDYGKLNHQQKHIAVRVAGTETVRCDAACSPADTMMADFPWFDAAAALPDSNFQLDKYSTTISAGHGPWGFALCGAKRGKAMLTVVPVPRCPPVNDPDGIVMAAHVAALRGYQERGQILGTCEFANRNGKGTTDVVMGTCSRMICHGARS